MGHLKQCDRCKFTGTVGTITESVCMTDGRTFDLCASCYRFIEQVLSDGGAQWEEKQ